MAVPGIPVETLAPGRAPAVVVATVRVEVTTAAPPEAAAAMASGTITGRDIVVPVNSGKLLPVLGPKRLSTERVSTGAACVATDAQTVVVTFGRNVELA